MAERLAPDAEGSPHLLIHDNCQNLINEFEGYVWQSGGKTQPEKPKKAHDHALDALRYGVVQLQRYGGWAVG